MTFTVYALRLRGNPEVRYVGQTAGDPSVRLARKLLEAGWIDKGRDDESARWFVANKPDIESVVLATVGSREEARALERQTVKMLLALNHRLFNRWLVPAELRAVSRWAA